MQPIPRAQVDESGFNQEAVLPYELRLQDFAAAMQDIYDLFYDVNMILVDRGLERFDEMLRPAAMSGVLSDALTAGVAKHSRALTSNRFHNGHPDLIVRGQHPNDAVQSASEGVEIKATRGKGSVDAHGARAAWLCIFYYTVDNEAEPISSRRPMQIDQVLLALLTEGDFRTNERGPLGTRTSSPDKNGLAKLRANWIYRRPDA